ncbi:MAG: hypothetical protein H6741_14340 [Alphaproteobacteria bacterium]|nr:hypothetical protein [Alphaproteobacteria bacterium]MCB9793895.1 hypothetical protein [Alphaproteobacteria bacterium]
MSLMITALCAVALAGGSLVRVGVEADPTLRPELRDLPVEQVFPLPPQSDPGPAVERLRAELEAVRPLADEFDGELAIMSRLDAVIADVQILRDESDRALLTQALLFQGFAVQRYFQDTLATDPAAAPYRREMGGVVAVSAWLDAAALDPNVEPSPSDIPGDDELAAFDEARALVRLAPKASVEALDLPEGAALIVDGAYAQGSKAFVPPGTHRARVVMDGQVLAWERRLLAAGEALTLEPPVMADALLALEPALSAGAPVVALPDEVVQALEGVPQPVLLAAPGKKDVLFYEVQGGSAVLEQAGPDEGGAAGGLFLAASVGGGWIYDGNYYTAQWDVAPHEVSTVNAGAPVLGARVGWSRGLLAASGGLDLIVPLGEYARLPSGDSELRLRAHPYVAAGLPWVQLSAGWLFPWHAVGGLRLSVPLMGPLELSGAVLAGPAGGELDRGAGEEPYVLSSTASAWLAVGGRFGLGR